MNQGMGTRPAACPAPSPLCRRRYHRPITIAAGASKSTRESLVMIAASRLSDPRALPAATAWAISCSDPPARTPNCDELRPSRGPSATSTRVNTVPRIATTATATTLFSDWRTRSRSVAPSGSWEEMPITAAAPQMPHPEAVRIAKWESTPILRASL